jgi:hypothetical protein
MPCLDAPEDWHLGAGALVTMIQKARMGLLRLIVQDSNVDESIASLQQGAHIPETNLL